ncbi:unnamed protein product [Rotaria sordida]|uniref:Uncharacterized protein n=1 Tax=Rotaria sordida TaxID=392033 RepID=A0A814AUH6_9BILA|nr:unnamed protein product [Rotaria sordida]CAF3707840.1 unnamed protein product [Rotaria sordida]
MTNNSLNIKQRTKNSSYSILFCAMIIFQIIAYGSYSILVHLCEKNGTITFSSVIMNFIIEFIKLLFSLHAFICLKRIHLNKIQIFLWLKQSILYSIPAILYFLNNNLAVHIQIHMDPTSYQILSNFKIFTTAILYRLIMKKRLIKQQWFALILLFFGGLTYSLGTFKSSSFISKTITNSTIIMRETYIRPLGIPMIVIYCTLSGLAGVYNEWILKRNYSESLHLQNIFLYTYGTIFNLIPAISMMITTSKTTNHLNLFHGFTFYTWLIVITQVLNGLIMSVQVNYNEPLCQERKTQFYNKVKLIESSLQENCSSFSTT